VQLNANYGNNTTKNSLRVFQPELASLPSLWTLFELFGSVNIFNYLNAVDLVDIQGQSSGALQDRLD
jgi:hypothetical protein